MEIHEMPAWIRVQNFYIVGWIVIEEQQFTKTNLGFEKKMQQVKINVNLKLVINFQVIQLLKEFENIFAWTYKDLKGIPPNITLS